ncbi:MAG: YceD family protein [Gallionellaceae bacterium]|jgi:uncharacterized protein
MFAHPSIDTLDFARNGGELRGDFPVASMSRLGDSLMNSEGSIVYSLSGLLLDNQPALELEISGTLNLSCQRCLGELQFPIQTKSRLLVLAPEDLEKLDAEDDVDAIEAATHFDVLSLIEDEVLLGLPFAPKHPEGECSPLVNSLQRSANPFAVLADLKKKNQ